MSLYNFSVKKIDASLQSMADYQDKVLLIVNVASQCGFTRQYAGLQALHAKYADQGLVVMGFPCDQFGHQEPGDDASILAFCQTKFSVDFPMFSKVDVNGAHAIPLYQWLKANKPGLLGTEMIKWNFTKFLVGRNGDVIRRFAPNDTPESLCVDIEQALKQTKG